MKTILVQIICCLLACLTASAAVRYVDLNNPNPAAPYTSWATAAMNIQDAVEAAVAGDEIVVTNGVYATGGRAVMDPNGFSSGLNRVAVDKAVSVRSVNGPEVTIILGLKADLDPVRCVYLTNGASLSGFTLTNGAASSGGGIWCAFSNAIVSNCVIIGNSASAGGGGAWGGTLMACKLIGNTAWRGGELGDRSS